MATPLYNAIDQLKRNQIRTQNMFEMVCDPKIAGVNEVLAGITIYGTGFTLPNRTQEFADIGFKGYTLPIPTVMKMEQDHTITVNADVQGNYRRAFLAWAGAVSNPDIQNVKGGGYSLFEGDRRFGGSTIQIHLLGYSMDTAIEIITMTGVRIQSVGGLTVSNTDSGVSTFDVQFKSLYWYIQEVKDETYNSLFTDKEAYTSNIQLTTQA